MAAILPGRARQGKPRGRRVSSGRVGQRVLPRWRSILSKLIAAAQRGVVNKHVAIERRLDVPRARTAGVKRPPRDPPDRHR